MKTILATTLLSLLSASLRGFPGKCDTCPEEHTDCKKLQLTGGSYTCLRQPCASKDYDPNIGDVPQIANPSQDIQQE